MQALLTAVQLLTVLSANWAVTHLCVLAHLDLCVDSSGCQQNEESDSLHVACLLLNWVVDVAECVTGLIAAAVREQRCSLEELDERLKLSNTLNLLFREPVEAGRWQNKRHLGDYTGYSRIMAQEQKL